MASLAGVKVLLWLAAFGLGSLTDAGLVNATGRAHGIAVLAVWVVGMCVATFVMVCVVTAMESVIPALRPRRA